MLTKEIENMKHGIRFWQTKLNKKGSHRHSLISNLLGQLVQHEQIQTTFAKAKVIQHEMEKVSDLVFMYCMRLDLYLIRLICELIC